VEINEAFKGTLHGNQKAQIGRDQWQFGRNNKEEGKGKTVEKK
jgi:hypothetical protein